MFYPLQIAYEVRENEPIIKIHGRDEFGTKIIIDDKTYEPYFYIIPDPKKIEVVKKRILEYRQEHKGGELSVKRVETIERIELNKKISTLKVVCHLPRDVAAMKDGIRALEGVLHKREYDIPFARRYALDHQISFLSAYEFKGGKFLLQDSPYYKPKVAAFDIEIYKPTFHSKENEIICIGIYSESEKKVLTWKKSHFKDAIVLKDEAAIIKKFFEVAAKYDVLATYNGDNFDLPFIKERAAELGMDCPISLNNRGAKVKDLLHVDLYNIVAKHIRAEIKTRSRRLNDVAKFFLDEGKTDFKVADIGKDIWDSDDLKKIGKLLEYNLQDCRITYLLAEKILPLEYRFSNLIGIDLFDATRVGFSQLVENYLMRKAVLEKILVPNKPGGKEIESRRRQTYIGGYVHKPIPGIYENISVLDFKSLYPTILVSHNISPDTLDENGETVVQIKNTTHRFRKAPEGFIVGIIDELIRRRTKLKKEGGKGVNEKALKTLANATYGYMGFFAARWYSRECAESITALGRGYIQNSILEAENAGLKPIYGDSITRERFIPILTPKGEVKIKNIEEFFNENEKLAIQARGKDRIALKGYKTLTLAEDSVVWSPIKELIRHKNTRRVFRVNQKYGETVVTEDHSLITKLNGNLVETKPTKLKTALVKLHEIPKVKEMAVLDMYALLKGYERIVPYKGTEKLAKIHKDEDWVGFGWRNDKVTPRLRRYLKIDTLEFSALCRLLGAYISEGSSSTTETTQSRYGASISGSEPWLKDLQKDYSLLFKNAKTCIIRSTKGTRTLSYATDKAEKTIKYEDTTHKLQMMNALSAVFFKMLCGQTSKGKKLPYFIFHSPEKHQQELIQTYLEGDGSRERNPNYSKEYREKQFRLTTSSLHLVSGFSFLLTQQGQKHTIRYRPSKSSYTLCTSSKYNARLTTKLKEMDYGGYVYDLSVEGGYFADACGLILLHNTDSVMVTGEKKEVSKFLKKINRELPGIMELEFEGFYPRGIFVGEEGRGTKKRYALRDEEGNIEIKGFEFVRGDWSKIAKETQINVVEHILAGEPKKAVEFVKETCRQIRKGEIQKEKLVISRQLTKPPEQYGTAAPHVKVARDLQRKDTDILVAPGMIVKYIITNEGKLISDRARWWEDAQSYDSDYYINHQVIPPAFRILSVLGYTKEDLKGCQSNLNSF